MTILNSKKLAPDTKMGPVHLTVSDLDRSLDYYRYSIGLRLIGRDGDQASLGTGREELLRLVELPGAAHVPRRTGLYHFALLLPSRQALCNALHTLIATETKLSGVADHLVSEALYLDDPDGNGIEIYRDRPRAEWPVHDGRLQMDTLPLDVDGILADAGDESTNKLPTETVMGHVHLHVAHLARAVHFYQEVIGFDLQAQMGATAAFMSAGGYHHHLGLNTWAGVGAPPPPPGAVGLRFFVIALPGIAAQDDLLGRLQEAQVMHEQNANGLAVRDPSNNQILFV